MEGRISMPTEYDDLSVDELLAEAERQGYDVGVDEAGMLTSGTTVDVDLALGESILRRRDEITQYLGSR